MPECDPNYYRREAVRARLMAEDEPTLGMRRTYLLFARQCDERALAAARTTQTA
jgi:hypothetical protein